MNSQKTHLGPWIEIVGRFRKLHQNDKKIQIYLSINGQVNILEYPLDSYEAQILQQEFADILEGTKVGIIETDLEKNPVKVRLVEG